MVQNRFAFPAARKVLRCRKHFLSPQLQLYFYLYLYLHHRLFSVRRKQR